MLTLGLGIGANVTMFSWTQIMLQRQIRGVRDGGRLVALNGTTRSRVDLSVSYPDFLDLRERRPDSVEDLIAFTLAPMSLRTNGGDPQRTFGQLVSGNFFNALGVRPALGRTFLPEEDTTPNGHPVVVISDSFWQRRFGGDPSIVGRTVMLNGVAYHGDRHRAAGIPRHRTVSEPRSLGADGDAAVGHERRQSPGRPRQLLARGDGQAQAGRHDRPRAGRLRCHRAKSARTPMPTTKAAG